MTQTMVERRQVDKANYTRFVTLGGFLNTCPRPKTTEGYLDKINKNWNEYKFEFILHSCGQSIIGVYYNQIVNQFYLILYCIVLFTRLVNNFI